MKLNLIKYFLGLNLIFAPLMAFAVDTPTDFKSFVGIITDIIGLLIPVIGGLAFLAFFWGLTKFIRSAGNEDAITEAKQLMLWGIIALVVMVSIAGIVKFFTGSFGFAPFQYLPEAGSITL